MALRSACQWPPKGGRHQISPISSPRKATAGRHRSTTLTKRAARATAGPAAGLAERIADRVCAIRYEDLSSSVIERTKDLVMFHIGSALGGRDTELGRKGREIAGRLGLGAGACTIAAIDTGATAVDAAFANAAQIVSRGDDYLLPAGGHPGIVTIPAALALAEQEHRDGRELVLAVVLGYELLGCLADLQWGWSARTPTRATIPFGAFGPVAASIRLLRLDRERAAQAISYAANMAMGLPENPFGGLYYGFVARNGITAAIAAEAGGTLPATTLEGDHGFFRSFFGEVPAGAHDVPEKFGSDWHVLHAQMKRWDTTGMNYPAIQLMLEAIEAHHLGAEDVRSVVLHYSQDRKNHATGHALGPFESKWHAASSGPFQLAVALLDGRAGTPERLERYDDPRVSDLLRRFEVILEETPTRDYARLEIATRDGRRIDVTRDIYETPPGTGLAWLRDEGARMLSRDRLEHVVDAFSRLEEQEDAANAVGLLRVAAV